MCVRISKNTTHTVVPNDVPNNLKKFKVVVACSILETGNEEIAALATKGLLIPIPRRKRIANPIINKKDVFASAEINGTVPIKKHNKPIMEPTRGDQISDNFPIKGSAIIVIIDAGNIINPASIGENV